MPATRPEDCDLLIFEHMRNKDLEAAVDLFEPDATFMLGDGQKVHGHEAIREALKGWINAVDLEWLRGPTAYIAGTGDIALLLGNWAATFRNEDGSTTRTTGKNTEVVRRQPDGTWRFIIDYANGAD